MKRILFLSAVNLFKRSGGGLATLSYFNAVCNIFPGYVDLALPTECIPSDNLHTYIPMPSRSIFSAIIRSIFGDVHRYRRPLIDYIKKNPNKYEFVLLNGGVYSGSMVDDIKKLGLKVAVIHHNCEYEYHMDNKSLVSFWGYIPYFVVRNEKRAYKNADVNLFLTRQDMATFFVRYGETRAKTHLLGCFEIEDSPIPKITNYIVQKNTIVVSGSLNSHQTTAGISDFFLNYFDISKNMIPNLKIILTGRDPSEEIIKLKEKMSDYAEIVPNPDDILSVVEKGDVFLCPTNLGGGLKLRIMDGLKLGMPVLTHKVSARGYDAFLNKPYFKVYDDEISFRDGLSSIIAYINSKNYSRESIRRDYFETFSFRAGIKRMREGLDKL